jgi:putative ABC transport system permease protein
MSTNTGAGLLFWRLTLRPLLANPRSSIPTLLGIALGVSVFLSITIANRSASESFRRAFEVIAGRADLEVRGRIPEELFPAVRDCAGVLAATPLVEATVTLPEFPGESLRLAGIDPFTALGLAGLDPGAVEGDAGERWIAEGDLLAVSPEFLSRHRLHAGEKLRIQGPGAPRTFLLATLSGEAGPAAGMVGAADIATVQEWLGHPGVITAILVKTDDRERTAARLRKLLPADVTVEPPAARTRQVDIMLSSFRLNLTAMSLVSLLVGMFFVGNSASAAVVRRRVSLGILRAVGAGRGLLMGSILAEAAVCGAVGSLIGVLGSRWLAGLMSEPVARTVSALYLPVESRGGWPTLGEACLGVGAGIVASLCSAWLPARQASRVDPVKVLHPGAAPEIFPVPVTKLALTGITMILGAAAISALCLRGVMPLLGFLAAFLVMAGFCLLIPAAMSAAVAGTEGLRTNAIWRLGLDHAMRSRHRTAPTAAALSAAVSMTVGVSVMIHSFHGSVVAWTDRTLTADLFIAPAANEVLGLEHLMPVETVSWWEGRPTVASVGTYRELEVRTPHGRSVTVGALSGPSKDRLDFIHGGGPAVMEEFDRGGTTVLSESLASKLGLDRGDLLEIEGPSGPLGFRVLDLCRDYTRDRGIALVAAEPFLKNWRTVGVHSLAVKFRKGTTGGVMEAEKDAFLAAFGGKEAFACYRNASLKDRIMEIFNQTFAVTAVLRMISIAVAVGGVMLTLGMLVIERTRDIGVLRAMGASPFQIMRMMLAEAAFLGLTASLVGIVGGTALSMVLTWVINKAFFGWSIDLGFPVLEILCVPLWMTAAAVLAGSLPALRASRIPPASALRME